MKTVACLALALATSAPVAHAEPAAPLFVIDQPNRFDNHGRVPWHVLVGDRHISETDFLDIVGLDELASKMRFKQYAALGFTVGGSLASMFTVVCAFEAGTNNSSAWGAATWVSGGAAIAMMSVGFYEWFTIEHLSVFDARTLADNYNAAHFGPVVVPGGGGFAFHRRF